LKALQLDGQHADEDGEIHEQPEDAAETESDEDERI